MITCVRAAVVLAILAYWPGLIEQFEMPKAAAVGVLGCGLLAATLASLLATRVKAGPGGGAAAPVGETRDRSSGGGRRPERGRSEAVVTPHRWHPMDLCMLAWLVAEIASTATSVAPSVSLLGDTELREGLITSAGLGGLYGAARFATRDAASARRTLLIILGAIAMSCLVAMWQLATFDRAQWENAPEYLGWYRPFGSLGHANLLGVATAAALSACVGLAASRTPGRAWWVAGGLLFGATTLLTLSRAAWLAAAAGSVAALTIGGRSPSRGVAGGRDRRSGRAAVAWSIAGIVVAAALVATIGPLRARVVELVSLGSGSGRSRQEIWKSALAMWRAHPWLGSGPDTFRLLFDRFQTPGYWLVEWGAAPFHAHSIYLHTLATRGVVGVLMAAAVVLAAMLALRDGRRTDAAGSDLIPGLIGLLVAVAAAGSSGALGIAGASVVACTLGTLPSLGAPRARAPARAATPRTLAPAPLLAGGLAGFLVLLPTVAYLRASRAAFQSGEEESGGLAIVMAQRAAALAPWSDVMASNAADVLRRRASRTDPNGTLAVAEREARRAIELAPQRLYNQSELALLLLTRGGGGAAGRDQEAAAAIARCMELGPYNIMPLVHYSELASRVGRPDLALPIARRAAEIYPREALPRAVLGEVHLALGETAAARAAMELSLTLEWRGDRVRREHVQSMLARLDAGDRGEFVLGRK